jgi:hypothetical protein
MIPDGKSFVHVSHSSVETFQFNEVPFFSSCNGQFLLNPVKLIFFISDIIIFISVVQLVFYKYFYVSFSNRWNIILGIFLNVLFL